MSDVFKTAGEMECLASLEENELILKVRGIMFDTVVSIGTAPPAFRSIPASELTGLIREAAEILKNSNSAYPTGEDLH